MTNWPTTQGMTARLDGGKVRKHLTSTLPKQWGSRVDARMKALGLNNAQLAVLSGTTQQTTSKVRRGEIAPREYLRYTIAAALCCTPEDLFPMPSMHEIGQAAS